LVSCGQLLEDAALIRRGIDAYRLAIDGLARSKMPVEWATAQANLGSAFFSLAVMTKDVASAHSAAAAFRLSREERSQDRFPVEWSITTTNLGGALRIIGELTGDVSFVREALEACRSAAETVSPDRLPIEWARAQMEVGRAHLSLCAKTDTTEDWHALTVHETRFRDKAATLVWTSTSVRDQLAWSRRITESAKRLTEGWLRLGRHQDAFASAQSGMAIQLSIGLHLSDATSPSAGTLQQARRDWRLACELAERNESKLAGPDSPDLDRSLEERHAAQDALRETFGRLQEAIERRGLTMPVAPTVAAIRAALPAGGAMILFVTGEKETTLFIVAANQPPDSQPFHCAVSAFTQADLDRLIGTSAGELSEDARSWLQGYDRFRENVRADGRVPQEAVARWNSVIDRCLRELGKKLMGPLASFLRDHVDLGLNSELVFVPTGMLSLLPLHAALQSTRTGDHYFLEDWTVSYAASPAAWMTSLRRSKQSERLHQGLLAVTTMPVRNPALDMRWSQGSRDLSGTNATRDAVIDALPHANCISFYCHGVWNPTNPVKSALVLHDGARQQGMDDGHDAASSDDALTVQDLQQVDLHRCRLALMWACESAMIGTRHVAEAIGFPAALVDAGVPAVVGSLWVVEAEATLQLARDMLSAYLQGNLTPSKALRRAQIVALKRSSHETATANMRDATVKRDGDQQTLARLGGGVVGETGNFLQLPHSAPFYWAAFTVTGAYTNLR
jgi:CHAT domain-containing protein